MLTILSVFSKLSSFWLPHTSHPFTLLPFYLTGQQSSARVTDGLARLRLTRAYVVQARCQNHVARKAKFKSQCKDPSFDGCESDTLMVAGGSNPYEVSYVTDPARAMSDVSCKATPKCHGRLTSTTMLKPLARAQFDMMGTERVLVSTGQE